MKTPSEVGLFIKLYNNYRQVCGDIREAGFCQLTMTKRDVTCCTRVSYYVNKSCRVSLNIQISRYTSGRRRRENSQPQSQISSANVNKHLAFGRMPSTIKDDY